MILPDPHQLLCVLHLRNYQALFSREEIFELFNAIFPILCWFLHQQRSPLLLNSTNKQSHPRLFTSKEIFELFTAIFDVTKRYCTTRPFWRLGIEANAQVL
jgi:hypothetical protein